MRIAAAQQAFANAENLDDFGFSNPLANATTGTALPQQGRAQQPRRRGHVTVVLGTGGGVGATEVSIELARALGKRGERTVLVDGDELAPSIAQRLNLSLHPNIRTAVDVVEHGSGRLSECLVGIASGMEALVGLPHPRDWIEMRGTDMTALVDELSRGRPHIVINASPAIEDLGGFGGTDRYGMTRAAVVSADMIVLVCPPTPMGIARLIDRAAELTEIADGKPVHVVVNKMPKSNYKRNEIAREIQRNFAPVAIHFAPFDDKIDKAAWEGTLAARGEFSKAITNGLATLVPKVAMGGGRKSRPAKAHGKK
jgi:MinD-like ATPase involved in chromosome partitioning or flagellar assembly